MSESTFVVIIVITALITSQGRAQNPVVTVAQGSLSGAIETSAGGRNYYAFRGVPYAKPPVGNLRFQPPQNPDTWDGIYDATQFAPACKQPGDSDEDCLYLNVYTPRLPDSNGSQPMAVLIFIHGGGFADGNSFVAPGGFMDKDIVFGAIAYRVGPFGFFSTGDDNSLGNYGMLDQVFALQWIRDNIAAFNGDPSRVTIFGQSAGGSSVGYHVLSPASKGLFHGAISESGSTVCPWAFQRHPLSWATRFAQHLGCPDNDTAAMTACVRDKSADELVQAAQVLGGYIVMILPFVPVLENNVTGRFLTEYPVKILDDGTFNKVPVMSGVNKDEGDLTYPGTQQFYQTIDDHFYNDILPPILYALTKYENNLINISYAVKTEYFDKIDITNQTQVARAAIDLNSDPFFKAPNDYTVRKLADGGVLVYTYAFEYAGSASHFNFTGEIEISHEDEMYYILFSSYNQFTEQDRYISENMINMWTNFANELNPTPSGDIIWNPTSNTEDLQYLRFGNDGIAMVNGYLTERMNFWTQTVPLIVVEWVVKTSAKHKSQNKHQLTYKYSLSV